jgi:capsid portal protein
MNQLPAFGANVPAQSSRATAFSFGDPEPVLNRREIMDMVECYKTDRWYEPPLSLDGLARAFRVSPHHSSAIMLKRNLVVASFDPVFRGASTVPVLSRSAFGRTTWCSGIPTSSGATT